MKEILLFPTVVHQYDLSNDPELGQLVELSKTMEFNVHRYFPQSTYTPNEPGGILDYPGVQSLKHKLNQYVNLWAKNMGCADIHINHNWLNRMGRGDRVERHRHEMSIASGALYVQTDDNSAGLIMHSPLEQLRMFERNTKPTWYNENYREFPCYAGLLLIFPSWLPHDTLPNLSDNRLVLSFNTTYK